MNMKNVRRERIGFLTLTFNLQLVYLCGETNTLKNVVNNLIKDNVIQNWEIKSFTKSYILKVIHLLVNNLLIRVSVSFLL